MLNVCPAMSACYTKLGASCSPSDLFMRHFPRPLPFVPVGNFPETSNLSKKSLDNSGVVFSSPFRLVAGHRGREWRVVTFFPRLLHSSRIRPHARLYPRFHRAVGQSSSRRRREKSRVFPDDDDMWQFSGTHRVHAFPSTAVLSWWYSLFVTGYRWVYQIIVSWLINFGENSTKVFWSPILYDTSCPWLTVPKNCLKRHYK